MGLDGVGLDGVGLDGVGLDGVGLDGVGLDGVGLDGVGLDQDGVGLDALAFHNNFRSLKLSVSTKINIIKSTLNNYDTKLSQILLIF